MKTQTALACLLCFVSAGAFAEVAAGSALCDGVPLEAPQMSRAPAKPAAKSVKPAKPSMSRRAPELRSARGETREPARPAALKTQ
jgi:hypothetical protein